MLQLRSVTRTLPVLVAALIASPAACEEACPEDARWGLVVDAGSSGSRLRLFCWRPGIEGALPWIEEVANKKQEPGVADADCTRTPEEAVTTLRPLIEYAAETIGEARSTRTPLSLLATAGLRQCPESYQASMLEGLRAYLADTPFTDTEARVISGLEEGRFGWTGINYLLGRLPCHVDAPLARSEKRSGTVGALDLGGVSTQITFMPAACPVARDACGELPIGEESFSVYSHSYLGWGQDEAMRAVGARACYLRGYEPEDGSVTGSGRYRRCRRAIRKTIRRQLRANPPEPPCSSSCSRLGAYQPPIRGDFVAFSAYAYTTDFLGLEPTLSLAELAAAGKAYCATRWQTIEAECAAGHRSVCDEWWLNRYCFSAAYIVTLLHDVYGFPMNERRVTSTNKLGGVEIDWTLGAMVQIAEGRAND